jgi:phage replication-related protein YjqB (UPF0714/DUF867 family)
MTPAPVSRTVTAPTVTTRVLADTATGHRTELLYDDGTNDEAVVCAAHGGDVEPGTAAQAIDLAGRLPAATCWACLGYDDEGEAFERFHPASSAIRPENHPLLGRIADREFETVISLHGLGEEGLLVGGALDSAVKHRVADRLDQAVAPAVEPVFEGDYAGVSPENFANWLARDGRGLQIEMGPGVRGEEADAVTDALEGLVVDGVLSPG